MWTFLLVSACTPEQGQKPVESEARADSADSDPPDCIVGEITPDADPRPARTVRLSIDAPDADIRWSTTHGTIDDAGVWIIGAALALNGPEPFTVTATVTRPGCATVARELTGTLDWPEAERVLVLYNPLADGSETVANHYADFRQITAANLCPVEAADIDTLDGTLYETFYAAVAACLEPLPQIWYIAPVYGVPYKISGRIADISSGALTTTSLDALLSTGATSPARTRADLSDLYQPGDSTTGTYAPWLPYGQWLADHRNRYHLVTRLDGADAQAAIDLIDRTRDAEALLADGSLNGIVYVDARFGDTPPATDAYGSYEAGEWNMHGTRAVFDALALWPVVWDSQPEEFGTAPAPLTCPDTLFYAGWYSFYHYNDVFTWAPGAVGGHLDSCSACDIRSMDTWSGGALQRGITATFGAVNEPYVAGMPEYDQFFLYLSQGAPFAEAAYASTTLAAWMMVWIGDPLYRPMP